MPVDVAPSREVLDDELLMRRLLPRKEHFRKRHSPPIQERAFWPGPRDLDGLSLSSRRTERDPGFLDEHQFQSACTHPDEKMRNGCGVVAILAETARAIGLEVKPDPILPEDPGHVLLPQINIRDFDGPIESRRRILEWIGQLIDAASQRILIAPAN